MMATTKKGNILLHQKMQENYSDIADFVKRSGIPLSFETVRRAVYLNKRVSITVLILLSKYLELIGEPEYPELTEQEKAVLDIYRRIRQKNIIANQLELIARSEGIDVSGQIMKIKRKEA